MRNIVKSKQVALKVFSVNKGAPGRQGRGLEDVSGLMRVYEHGNQIDFMIRVYYKAKQPHINLY